MLAHLATLLALVATAPADGAVAPAGPDPASAPTVTSHVTSPPPEPVLAATAAPAARPEPESAPSTAPRAAQAPPPAAAEDDTWIDFGHAFIGNTLFAPVFRVDRFFSDQRDLEADRARSFLRWRNELRFREGSSRPTYTTTVSASLRFPSLNKQLNRMHLEILGQTRDTFTTLFPRSGTPGDVPAPTDTVGTADAGLALRLWETVESHADVGAGITLALPPGAYTRLRFRWQQALGWGLISREATTGFWRTDTGFGTTGSADLERPLGRSTVARLAGSTTVSEVSQGFEWFGDLSLATTFRSRIGAAVGTSISGATRGPVPVGSYRVYTRFRRDFYRRWIFLELEPDYSWPWSAERGRYGMWSVAFRLEVQFQGNERSGRPATAAP